MKSCSGWGGAIHPNMQKQLQLVPVSGIHYVVLVPVPVCAQLLLVCVLHVSVLLSVCCGEDILQHLTVKLNSLTAE